MDTPPPNDFPPPDPPILLPASDLPPLGVPVILEAAGPSPRPPLPLRHIMFGLVVAAVAVGEVVMLIAGGELHNFAAVGLELLPFVLLAIFAYGGERSDGFKVVTLIYWLLLVGGFAVVTLLMTFGVLMNPAALAAAGHAPPPGPPPSPLLPGGGVRLAVAGAGTGVALILGFATFIPNVRRAAAHWLPLNPGSFVHAVALATVVALSGLLLVPLIATSQTPLVLMDKFKDAIGPAMAEQMSDRQMLLAHVYFLFWMVPLCFVTVGYPLHRTLPAAARRLGLDLPGVGQVVFGVFAAGALVVLITMLEIGIEWLWTRLGWPRTDTKSFEKLMQFAFNPLGAVVIGVVAGLGEELFARGVLQPRLGILLSNLFFTSLHAWQYNWDGLLSVFVIGLILGVIRKKTNTTTSAIVHGTYDCLLLLLTYYQVDKWLDEWLKHFA
jgi:membrane protease YdiL (CAAX protease family)